MRISKINPNDLPLDHVLPSGLTMGEAITRMRTYADEIAALEQILTPLRLDQLTDRADQWACLPFEALERAIAAATASAI